jgi:hypothetical protein
MLAPSFSISPNDLWSLIGSPAAPQIIDVRRRQSYDAAGGVLPAAMWRRQGFIVYDALFAWLRFAAEERHNLPAKVA